MPTALTTPGIEIQERDIELLRGLFESRLMTLHHVAALHFESKPEAAKKRLQKLKAAGMMGEKKRRVSEPSILFLTLKGFSHLSDFGHLLDYPSIGPTSFERRAQVSELTIHHELAVMDVKAALCAAIAETANFKVAEFSTWPLLYQFTARRPPQGHLPSADVLIKPDGFLRIHENEPDGGLSEHTFFLEVDRSTETQETLAMKAAGYNSYYRAGGLAVRNGEPVSAYQKFPFRVLYVLKSAERRDNIARRLLQNNPPTLTQVWLATLGQLLDDPLGSVWICPKDFQRRVTQVENRPCNPLLGQ